MKFNKITIIQRLILSNFLSLIIVSFAIFLVIKSLYYVESTLKHQASEHINILTTNSDISRRVFLLTSRVKLLEQTFLFSETTLAEEASSIDIQLHELRELSTNKDFSKKMDGFIDSFHRFLGSSVALNRILKQVQVIDNNLSGQIDTLEFAVLNRKLQSIIDDYQMSFNDELDSIGMLREVFLFAGKKVGNIHSRITPETEKTLIIEISNELDIFLLHIENIHDTPAISDIKKGIKKSVLKYHAALRKIRANLDQRWSVMQSLVDAQDQLLEMVESTEINVQKEAISLTTKLESEIVKSRFNAIVISIFAFLLSMLLISLVVRRHIRKPLLDLQQGFENLESNNINTSINIGRTDEWSHIQNAFNTMALRLSKAYLAINEEKKNFDFLAHHDPLTGLANRLLATKHLNQCIKKFTDNNSSFLLFYLDIDEFKTINDSLGHTSGDNLLINVANKLKEVVKDNGFVARMGGDEFMVIIDGPINIEDAKLLPNRINNSLRQPYYIGEKTIFVSTSIGVCQFPTHGNDGETLIRNADTAMYYAKRNGKDQYRFYENEMTLEVTDLIETNLGLRQAITNNELVVLFQPKIETHSNKVIGSEALIRWQHPKLGLLEPSQFLEVAEKTDLIIDIDKWVFKKVASLICQWTEDGVDLEGMLFSVNFSARMFYLPNIVDQLENILKETKCKPHQIILEITERDMMRDFVTCVQTIQILRTQGYKIAIDDFGTGYSSLSVLKNLSVDYLKLDRSFVQDIYSSTLDFEITNTILQLAQTLGLSVIAEGVETQRQLDTLIEMGCDRVQGYYFSKPLAIKHWLNYLSENKARVI